MNQNCIPIVVGVTGHRDLRDVDVPALERAVADELGKLKTQYPHSPIRMLNSLASGADTLCARTALSMGISLFAALPMEKDEYEKDFDENGLAEFRSLCDAAEDVFVAPDTEPLSDGRDYHYRQAGIYVAAHSHVLLALWDGTEGSPNGCGTAEAVGFMLRGSFSDGRCFRASNDGAVLHVQTSRASKTETHPVSVRLLENESGSLREILAKTDAFNEAAQRTGAKPSYSLLPQEYLADSVSRRLHNAYFAADSLSMSRQKGYLNILGCFALFSVLLVLFYLLYDEAELYWCLIGYGLTIGLYALLFRLMGKHRQHDTYLQYRALAEALRVQLYLHALGIRDCVCDDFTWTQKYDFTWIKEAVCALLIGRPAEKPVPPKILKRAWIDNQKAYHEKAGVRNRSKYAKQVRTTRIMLACTLLTWIIVFLLEYAVEGSMSLVFLTLTLRTWFKILWGCLSAVTVFVAGYYGKLSLERKSFDNEKMAILFTSAAEQYESDPENRLAMFRQLAREELIENGNWVSYCRENTPDFSL